MSKLSKLEEESGMSERLRPPTEQREYDQFRRRTQSKNGPGATGVAKVMVHEDESAFVVQIELAADHAITLQYWNAREKPGVALWVGSGESSFADYGIEGFCGWTGRALGFITAPYGACFDCDFDTSKDEFYILQEAVWKAACEALPRLGIHSHKLCIDCLERRLGRELTRADFKTDHAFLHWWEGERVSDRLRDRLARKP
jgi:hypothetical protein